MACIHPLQAARLLFLSIICSGFCYLSDAGTISCSFPPETYIQLSEDASIYGNVIQLTKGRSGLGWATYSNIIPYHALANFSTHFQFSMVSVNGSGDGLTFFLAPFEFESSDADPGEWLGLFASQTDGDSSNQILAVEFDTYKNDFDPDDNHVGIDVNSVKSEKTVSVSDHYTGATLNNGEKWEAWVDYNGTQIQVFLLYNPGGATPSKPESPVLWHDIDLSQLLAPNVKVGFSASTGVAVETHAVHAWNFVNQYSSQIPVPTPTIPPGISNPSPPSHQARKRKVYFLIGLIIGIVVFVLLIIGFYICCCSRRNAPPLLQAPPPHAQVPPPQWNPLQAPPPQWNAPPPQQVPPPSWTPLQASAPPLNPASAEYELPSATGVKMYNPAYSHMS